MVANIDRRIKGERAGLECKTSRDIYMRRYRGGDFPMEYYCQCLHYLAVTGWDAWYLAVLVYGTDLKIFKICRGEAQDDINKLIEAEQAFWQRYIEDGRTPPPDDFRETGRVLEGMWAADADYWMDATLTQDATLNELAALKAEKKALEKQITGIENRLKAEMEDATELRGTDVLATWKPQRQRRISERKIRELYPMVDISKIKEEVEMRRFCVKTEEEE
jgi:predicted phage-related endonuclease